MAHHSATACSRAAGDTSGVLDCECPDLSRATRCVGSEVEGDVDRLAQTHLSTVHPSATVVSDHTDPGNRRTTTISSVLLLLARHASGRDHGRSAAGRRYRICLEARAQIPRRSARCAFRPTQQRAGPPRAASGLLLCQAAGLSPGAPGGRLTDKPGPRERDARSSRDAYPCSGGRAKAAAC